MMESPMTRNCHVGFGERYEETHQSQDWEVRFVPTPLSPLLANIALHGMENVVKNYAATLKGTKITNQKSLSLIRYADDFVILHKDPTVVKTCKRLIEEWLTGIGLELNQEKTKILHTLHGHEENKPGFDFLGFNIRQYPVGKFQSGKNPNGKILGFNSNQTLQIPQRIGKSLQKNT